jgi:hypothetical protein
VVQSGLDDNPEDNIASVVVPVEFKAAVEINGFVSFVSECVMCYKRRYQIFHVINVDIKDSTL